MEGVEKLALGLVTSQNQVISIDSRSLNLLRRLKMRSHDFAIFLFN